jgi:CheY-like chemotaxis protein
MERQVRRILIVDDNQDSVETMAVLLKIFGHVVATAQDGMEAVETARAFRPDIALLDLSMPKLNGYDAARRMREESGQSNLLLVALTGWAGEEAKRRSMEAGFDVHMVKPIDFAALEKLVAES